MRAGRGGCLWSRKRWCPPYLGRSFSVVAIAGNGRERAPGRRSSADGRGPGPSLGLPAEASADDPRLLRQAEGTLPDDVPLDLTGARIDGAGPAAEEHALPGGDLVAVAFRPQQAVSSLDRHRDLAQLLVVLAPEELGDGGLGARRAARRDLGEGAQAAVPHQLHLRVGPGEALADQRVVYLAPLASGLDQLPELPLVAEVRHGGAP